MRVALVSETYLPSIDGVVTRMRHTVDYLAGQGHEVLVVAPDVGTFEHEGYGFQGTPALTYPFYSSRKWGRPCAAVGRALADWGPDIVHVWQPELVGFSAVRHCIGHGIPLVTSYHTDISAYLDYYPGARLARRAVDAYERYLHNSSPITLATSEAMVAKLHGRGFGGVEVIPKGVDLGARDPSWHDEDMRAELSQGHPGDFLALYVGRLANEKALDTLAPMMGRVQGVRLALVGDGPARHDLERAFSGTPTYFTGFLEGERLSRAFASADCFVFPSTTETLGLVLLEAMASGLPVCAAASPATHEVLGDGRGFIWDGRDGEGCERAIERLRIDGGRTAEVVGRALAYARRQDWSRAGQAMVGAYERSLDLYASGWHASAHPARRAQGTGPDDSGSPDEAGGTMDGCGFRAVASRVAGMAGQGERS